MDIYKVLFSLPARKNAYIGYVSHRGDSKACWRWLSVDSDSTWSVPWTDNHPTGQGKKAAFMIKGSRVIKSKSFNEKKEYICENVHPDAIEYGVYLNLYYIEYVFLVLCKINSM